MADQFDFTVKTNPMQGVSLADLVAARTPNLTSVLQSLPPALAVLQARKQQAQKQQLIAQASQSDPQTAALLELGIVPPQFKSKPPLTPQQAEELEAAKSRGRSRGKLADPNALTAEDYDVLGRALREKGPDGLPRLVPSQLTYRGPRAKILATSLRDPGFSATQGEAMFRGEQQRARTLNSQQTTEELASISQFKEAANQLLEAAREIPRTSFIPLNRFIQNFDTGVYASDSPEYAAASKLKALQSEIGLQASRVFSGSSPTDIRFRTEQDRLPIAGSIEQLETVLNTLVNLADMRGEFITEMPTLTPRGIGQPVRRTITPAKPSGGQRKTPSGISYQIIP